MNLETGLLHSVTLFTVLHLLIFIGIATRVILKRPAAGVALSWLLIVGSLPLLGGLMYLLIGERRMGIARTRRLSALREEYRRLAQDEITRSEDEIDWSSHPPAARFIHRLGINAQGFPTLHGSSFELHSDALEILRRIRDDVDAARHSVLMEFYIWNEGGAADEVVEALIRAARRGVICKVLVDSLGAMAWWKGEQPERLRAAGVQLEEALPMKSLQDFLGRTDMRLHRKIVVVDGEVAWTGSMNLVDPRYFKQEAGVGEWVDAMVRLRGAVVAPLAVVMLGDWVLETGETVSGHLENGLLQRPEPAGDADIQVYSSGPGQTSDGLLQMLLTLINAAGEEVVITSPYLVPDESLLRALRGAALRGVATRIVVPARVDSFLVRHAGSSFFDDLLPAGVEIHLYEGGLLHTKSMVVDGRITMFGTANMDMRSFWLNYEVSLFVYDESFARVIRDLQQEYLDDARQLDPRAWAGRPFRQRFFQDLVRLFTPLL